MKRCKIICRIVKGHDARLMNHFSHDYDRISALENLNIVVVHTWRKRRPCVKTYQASFRKASIFRAVNTYTASEVSGRSFCCLFGPSSSKLHRDSILQLRYTSILWVDNVRSTESTAYCSLFVPKIIIGLTYFSRGQRRLLCIAIFASGRLHQSCRYFFAVKKLAIAKMHGPFHRYIG